jgi:hypothetical protein
VNALDHIAEKYPLSTGLVGGTASLVSWLMDHLENISRALSITSQFIGLGIGILTLALLWRRWKNPKSDDSDDLP